MKLSRNKIRKIRKQQHQSVRKWKKQHRSSARRSTFRRSRRQNMTGILTKYPSKLNNVVNRTLKKYITFHELTQIKENYKKMRRMRRKQKHYNMVGGVDDVGAVGAVDAVGTPKNTGKKAPFSLGPTVKGDISIRTETHLCQNEAEVYKLVQFLIQNGLPYYIKIDMEPGSKPTLSKNDTDLFDLRRILYGKFVKDIKTISKDKRELYFEEKAVVGIANGDTLGNEYPEDLFIYTGEKCQIQEGSSDTAIQVQILQKGNKRPSDTILNSNRLYTLKGADKAKSIDTVKLLQKLDSKNKIDTSEFRLQVAPLTEDEFKKDAENVASGNEQGKNVVDESNTYVVNLKVGCKITSVQTLRKSLEKARASLENENDKSKSSAMDIFKMLNELLQNPEFEKTAGYDDFKEQVYGFSYKIHGSERQYGISQLMTFFNDNKENLPPSLSKEFFKIMNLLGHGPGGGNGDCLAFEGSPFSVWETRRLETEDKDGKIVTKITDKLDSASNVNGFAKLLSKLGQVNPEKDDKTTENGSSTSPEASLGASAHPESDSEVASSTTPSPEASAAAPAAAPSIEATTLTAAIAVITAAAAELSKNKQPQQLER
jgi:hypothetical protein